MKSSSQLYKKAIVNPFVVSGVYLVFGSLWVLGLDHLLLFLFDDPEYITKYQSLKGEVFVALSAGFILMLARIIKATFKEGQEKIEQKTYKFKQTFDEAPVGIAHLTIDGKWLEVNATFRELLGYSNEELQKLEYTELIHPDDLENFIASMEKILNGSKDVTCIEEKYKRKDGSLFSGLTTKSLVKGKNGNPNYFVLILEDISIQKQSEAELSKILAEKEVLLMEVHHRVRNNLALMSAFFDLQMMEATDEKMKEVLEDNKSRIKSLALIHESFADTEKANQINFGDYLNDLVDYVDLKCSSEEKKLQIEKKVSSIDLNINQAVPSGLFCNEILNHICIYTQKELRDPYLNITLSEEDEKVVLFIRFNGDIKTFDSLKVKGQSNFRSDIISTLKRQLKGDLDIYKKENDIYLKFHFLKNNNYGSSSSIKRSKKLFKN